MPQKFQTFTLSCAGMGSCGMKYGKAGERLLGERFTLMTLPRQRMPELYQRRMFFCT